MSVRLSLVDLRDPSTLVQVLEEAFKFVPQIHWFDVLSPTSVDFPSPADPFSYYHKLGVTPIGMVQDPLAKAIVWADAENRREWGPQRVVLRCDVANVMLRIGLIV